MWSPYMPLCIALRTYLKNLSLKNRELPWLSKKPSIFFKCLRNYATIRCSFRGQQYSISCPILIAILNNLWLQEIKQKKLCSHTGFRFFSLQVMNKKPEKESLWLSVLNTLSRCWRCPCQAQNLHFWPLLLRSSYSAWIANHGSSVEPQVSKTEGHLHTSTLTDITVHLELHKEGSKTNLVLFFVILLVRASSSSTTSITSTSATSTSSTTSFFFSISSSSNWRWPKPTGWARSSPFKLEGSFTWSLFRGLVFFVLALPPSFLHAGHHAQLQ